MKLNLVYLAVASLCTALASPVALAATQDDSNKPLLQGQPKAEDTFITIQGVELSGTSSMSSDNAQALQNYAASKLVGPGKSIKDIQAVAAEMTQLFFRSKGFEFSRVYVPVQSLDEKNAVLKLAILEGKYGRVSLKGVSKYNQALIESRLGIKAGEQLETKRLERGLLLVDDLPGLKVVNVSAVPGQNTGESDYTVNLEEEKKLSLTVLADNQGSKSTGENRFTARFAVANLTNHGDELEGGITYSGKGLTAGQIAYSMPFSIGDMQGWKASAALSKINYRLTEASVQSLDAYGTSEGVSLALTYPIIRSQDTNVGFSTQVNHQNLKDFVLGSQYNKKTSNSVSVGLSGDWQRAYFPTQGASSFNWTTALTMGRLNINDENARQADELGARTQGSFNHLNASMSWNQSLNTLSPRLSTYVSLSGQYANKNLDSSEKFVLTGPSAVRGYSQGTVSVDSGAVMNAEIRYLVPTGNNFATSVYAFYDYGTGKTYQKNFGNEFNNQSVSAVGIGATVRHTSGLFASLSLSKGHGYKAPFGVDKKDNTFAWLQVGYRY